MASLKRSRRESIEGSQGATKTYVQSKINAIPEATPATPGGSSADIQFNDSGAFGGESVFTYINTVDANGIYMTNLAKNANFQVGYNNNTQESYVWSSGVGNTGGFKIGVGEPAAKRFSISQAGNVEVHSPATFTAEDVTITGDLSIPNGQLFISSPGPHIWVELTAGDSYIYFVRLPTSDPLYPGQLWQDGSGYVRVSQ